MSEFSKIQINSHGSTTGVAGSVGGNQNNQITHNIYNVARKTVTGISNFARAIADGISYPINQLFPSESEDEREKMLLNYLIQGEIQRLEFKDNNLKASTEYYKASTKYFNNVIPIEEARNEEDKRHNQVIENIEFQKLQLAALEFKFKIHHQEKIQEIKEKLLNIEEKRLEIEAQTLELMRESQHRLLASKSDEIQGFWDAINCPLTLSPQNTKDFFQKQHRDCDLFIFFSPLNISEDSHFVEESLNKDLENNLDMCLEKFSDNSQSGCITKFYKMFKNPIGKTEAEYFIDKFSPIPIIIFSGDISTSDIYIRISFMKTIKINFNWRDIYNELVSKGATFEQAISIVKSFIDTFYQVLLIYVIDLYFLCINCLYEIKLPSFINDLLSGASKQWLINDTFEPYLKELINIQKKQKSLAYYEAGYKYYQAGLQARILYQLEKKLFQKALSYFEESVNVKDDDSDVWHIKGVVEFEIQRYSSTINSCEQAIKLDSKHIEAWFYKGQAFEKLAKQEENQSFYKKAIFCYFNAIPKQPKLENERALENLGLLFCELGNYEKAIIILDNYIEIKPDNEGVWLAKGRSLFNLKHYKLAADSFRQVTIINQENEKAWLLRGTAAFKIWDIETAIYSFYQAIKINPDNIAKIIQHLIKEAKNALQKIVIKEKD